MLNGSGRTKSVWMQTPLPTFSPLQEDLRVEVCIVGAGIAGLTTAYLCAREGRSVAVLEDGEVAGGESSRTTAHLASAQDDRFFELERLHGPEGARLTAQSHAAAIDRIEAIVAAESIDCEFERLDGYLFLAPGHSDTIINWEFFAARRAGLKDVYLMPRLPFSFFDPGPCLRFGRQGQFHPLKYLAGVVRGIGKAGGRIFANTHAAAVEGGLPGRVVTDSGRIVTADAIVVATNSPINDRFVIHTKQAPYRTYVIALRVPRGAVPRGLYWDTLDPYHYIRLTREPESEEELLVVGGEDHKTGQPDDTEDRFDRLEAWVRPRFPMAAAVAFRWSGQVMEPVDGLAFIGRNPLDKPNVFIATGDSGQGMTHGTIAGMLLTDLIGGRDNPWATLYDPGRKTLRAAGEFAGQNLNVAQQYGDLLTPGEVESEEAIGAGSGAVMRHGLKKVAVYRDETGLTHRFAAECPHLGCVICWNSTEHTWDCPCHGSRFDPFGHVVNGPANRDLTPAESPAYAGRE